MANKPKLPWKSALGQGAAIGAGAVIGQAIKNATAKPAEWSTIYAEQLLKNQAAKEAALRAGALGAGVSKALTATVPAAAGVAIPAVATGLGVASILKAKNRLNSEINKNSDETNARWDYLRQAAINQRKKKINK